MSADPPSTDPARGLTASEVRDRELAGLSNRISRRSSRSVWSILRANVFTLFNAIVGGSFVLLLALGQWRDALFGFSALANAVIGVVQEVRAKRSLDRLALLSAPRATVVRDGVEVPLERERIVVDDVLVVRVGDQIPVDAELVEARGLSLDESLLTGESAAVAKSSGDELLAGSGVAGGSGRAVVRRVGEQTFAATISGEARRFSLARSEIRDSIDRVLRWIAFALAPVMLIVVNGQMQSAGGWQQAIASGAWRGALTGAAGAAIAMVPLGLVLLTSVAFTIATVRLARQQVLVQELAAVEGLARVDVVCFDKTGTLTDGAVEFDSVQHAGEPDAGWRDVLAAFAADPSANATARALATEFDGAAAMPIRSVPFSSTRKWSAELFAADSALAGSWVLGAPEIVLAGRDDELSRATLDEAGARARAGHRMLLLARSGDQIPEVDGGTEPELPAGLRAQAVLVLRERLRPDSVQTVAYFREQGVQLRIISGDDPRTVAAVARQVGIEVEHGFDARELPTDITAMAAVLEREVVFGRVTPAQKRDMVQALRSTGHVVAMTGDGVNDILALKAADMGIAMGSGAPATRAVARLVLLDGRFSHLPGVVNEGRRVIANVERVAKLFLSKTAYSLLIAVSFGAVLWAFPFLPRQLSVLDGLTLGIPGFFLAFLPNARRYRPGFLGRALGFAIPVGLAVAGAMVAINVTTRMLGTGTSEARVASSIVLTLVALWVLNVLMRPLTRWRLLLLVAMHAGLLLLLVTPLVADFLHFALPSPLVLAWSLGIVATASLAIELLFRGTRRREERRAANA